MTTDSQTWISGSLCQIRAAPPGRAWEDWTELDQVPMMARTIGAQRNRA